MGANDKGAARLLRCPGVVLRAAVIEAERGPWARLERNLHVGGELDSRYTTQSSASSESVVRESIVEEDILGPWSLKC